MRDTNSITKTGKKIQRLVRRWLALGWAISVGVLMTSPAMAGVLLNAEFGISDSQSPLYGWTAPFSVTITNNRATLLEDGIHLPVRLQQRFDLSAQVSRLQITLDTIQLATNAPGQPPDAFQISLLNTNMASLVPPTGQPESAAFISFQQNGQVFFGPGVTVPGVSSNGAVWTPQFPLTISVNLTNITSSVPALLYFDLVGFDRAVSRVVVRSVRFVGWEPLGGTDVAETLQDTAVSLRPLTNDIARSGYSLNPASWRLEVPPAHGVVTFQSQTGQAVYQPTAGYVGSDAFSYSIADMAGHRSDPVMVLISVTPVSQDPKDAWRRQFFSPTDLADPSKEATIWGDSADPDRDGRNNLQEYVTGTVPTNAASRLEFTIERSAGGVRMRVTPRVEGRLYNVLTSRRVNGPFLPLTHPQVQTNGTQLVVTELTTTTGPRFYRLQVIIWPSAELLAWRRQYFAAGDLVNSAKEATVWGDQADPDGDGRNNFQEFIAGTVPTNAASRLLFSVERGTQGVVFHIVPRATNRVYTVLSSGSLMGSFEPVLNTQSQMIGNELIIRDTTPGTNRVLFYRLAITLP